ncbi:MAG: phospholipase D family protein [Arenimonas sp.]
MPDAKPPRTRIQRLRRVARWGLLALVLFMGSGWLLADKLMPRATGAPSHALAIQPAQTELDRELAPQLAAHPGQTGVIAASDGLEAFAMRAIATRKAGRSIDLMYFIWKDDLAGRLLAREVYAAAARGVRVRMLLDDINLSGLDPKLLALDAQPNIELRVYNPFVNRESAWRPLEMAQRLRSLNHRMHNKAWIADGRVAIVGGRNIGEAYFSAADVNFRDFDLLLFGPAVAQVSTVFDTYWNSAAAVPIASLHPQDTAHLLELIASVDVDAHEPEAAPYLARVEASQNVLAYHRQTLDPHWTSSLRIVADPPLKGRDGRARCAIDKPDTAGCDTWMVDRIVADITSAKREALVITPYFVPGDAGSAALVALAGRGTKVGIVTNSLAANDVAAVHAGYTAHRPDLLAAGIQLHELRARRDPAAKVSKFGSAGASLHTKAYVLDGQHGFVGSFNLDPRSADLNTEMGVLFDDPGIAADVAREYARLTEPVLSYGIVLDREGDVRWIDAVASPPRLLDQEPDTDALARLKVRVYQMLPLESQL